MWIVFANLFSILLQ